jgi:ribosome-associated protein
MTVPEITLSALKVAAAAAEDKLAENIVAFDVAERLGLTDAFLVASGASERQVNAIVDGVEEELLIQEQLKPIRREGRSDGHWVLLDYGHFVVHVQHAEDREFYALDRLWKDSPAIDLGLEGHASPASAGEPEPEFPAEPVRD